MSPDPRRFRWFGEPDEELPDVGDVLVLKGSDPERYLLVHAAAQVRGREPWDLWLVVSRHVIDVLTGGIPQEVVDAMDGGGRFIHYVPMRRRQAAA